MDVVRCSLLHQVLPAARKESDHLFERTKRGKLESVNAPLHATASMKVAICKEQRGCRKGYLFEAQGIVLRLQVSNSQTKVGQKVAIHLYLNSYPLLTTDNDCKDTSAQSPVRDESAAVLRIH